MADIRRTYFTFPATFDPDNPTNWGTVLSSIKVDGIETLTAQYYLDIDPDGETDVDYSRCEEIAGLPVCDLSGESNTYNPFLMKDPAGDNLLIFPLVYGYRRGQVTGTLGSVDYGAPILTLGASAVNAFYADDYPETEDVREAFGSIFFDIDYDSSFSAIFKVYKLNVYVFEYKMTYDKDTGVLAYHRISKEYGSIDVRKYGWLSGIESNPYITAPQPVADDCTYAVRTLGYAMPIILPVAEPQISSDCCKAMHVFGSSSNDNREFNDFTSDFYYRNLDSDTVSFILKNVDNGFQTTILPGTIYGSLFEFGDIEAQPDLAGVVIEWRLVLLQGQGDPTNFGEHNYQINKQIETAGQVVNIEGTIFSLKEFSVQRADRTVRITTVQNGDILHLGVAFKGVQWASSIRVPGYFGLRDPKFTQDNVVYRDYQARQISMRQENEYSFKTEQIKDCVFREIMDFMLLANEIYISDYNLENHSDYKNVSVELVENEGTEYLKKKSMLVNLIFTDRSKNRLKSNYGLTQIAGSKFLEGTIGDPPSPPDPNIDVYTILGYFNAGEDELYPLTVDNSMAATYQTLTFDGASGTVSLTVNAIAVTVPIHLSPGDIVVASRTINTGEGYYKLTS